MKQLLQAGRYVFLFCLFFLVIRETVYAETQTEKTYIVPIEQFLVYNGTSFPLSVSATTVTGSNDRLQIQDKAVVQVLSDGRCVIRLRYAGDSIWDMIQVVDPQYNSLLEDNYAGQGIPLGTIDQPQSYKNEENYQGFLDNGAISKEIDQYLLSGANMERSYYDEQLDIGEIEYIISKDSVDDYHYILSLATGSTYTKPNTNRRDLAVQLKMEDAVEVQENGQYFLSGSHQGGFSWSNYGYLRASHPYRNSSTFSGTLNLLNGLFEDDVEIIMDNDRMKAVFTVRNLDGIVWIGIADSKAMYDDDYDGSNGSIGYFFQEFAGTTYTEVYNEMKEKGTLTLDFEDLSSRYYFKIETEESQLTNENYSRWTFYWNHYGLLSLEPEVIDHSENKFNLESNGAVLTGDWSSIPSDSDFKMEVVAESPHVASYESNAYKRFSKDGDHYYFYDVALNDDQGVPVTPTGTVKLELPVPEGFDLDNLTVVMIQSNGQYLMNSSLFTDCIDREDRIFTYETSKSTELNATYVFFERGVPIGEDELKALSPGYYQVRTTLAHANTPYRQSMSNNALTNNQGILHVYEGDSGSRQLELYLDMESVQVSELVGYMTKVSHYQGTDRSTKMLSNVLAYHMDADGMLQDDLGIAKDYRLHYVKRISIPLVEPVGLGTSYEYARNSYRVSFVVPIMDASGGVPGDGNAESAAYLSIIDIDKENRLIENPLGGYDESVLLAAIETAGWFLETLESGQLKEALTAAVITAQKTLYSDYPQMSQMAELNENTLLAAVEQLHQAYLDAGGEPEEEPIVSNGTWQVPTAIYDWSITGDLSVESTLLKPYFDVAKVLVQEDLMTVTLYMNQTASGDYVTSLTYDDGYGVQKDAEIQALETGEVTSITFTRPYTEDVVTAVLQTKDRAYDQIFLLCLEFAGASRIEVSDEDRETLKAVLEAAKAKLPEADQYTTSSYHILTTAIQNAETYSSVTDMTYDTCYAQITTLYNAMEALVSLSGLRQLVAEAKLAEAKEYKTADFEYLQTAVQTAEVLLLKEDASQDEVTAQEAVLRAAIDNRAGRLEDGIYAVPLDIYASGTTIISNINRAFFDVEEVLVAGEKMTVTLKMTDSNSKWITQMWYAPDWDSSIVNGTAMEVIDTDSEGNVVAYQFTLDYTEELIHLWLNKSGTSYTTQAELYLDFVHAVEHEVEEEIDISELMDLITQAGTYDCTIYTTNSYDLLLTAIEEAQAMLELGDYTVEMVAVHSGNLQVAMEEMLEKGSVTELEVVMESAATILTYDFQIYTAETVKQLETELSAINVLLLDRDNMIQSEIDLLTQRLEVAIDALVSVWKEHLVALITECEVFNQSNYKADSWALFAASLEAAITVSEQDSAADEAYQSAYVSLTEAKAQLQEYTKADEVQEALSELLNEINGMLMDIYLYEASSLASYRAFAEHVEIILANDYRLSEEELICQMEALQAEYNALILNSGLSAATTLQWLNVEMEELDEILSEDEIPDEDVIATSSNAASQTATSSNALALARSEAVGSRMYGNGTYTVNFALYKYEDAVASMGNPAFAKPGTMIIKNGTATIYMQMQGMDADSIHGHLLWIKKMTVKGTNSSGDLDYTLSEPSYITYRSSHLCCADSVSYPDLVGIEVDMYALYSPVMVYVPAMGASAEQPARILIDWNSMEYKNASTNIDGSLEEVEEELDTEELLTFITKVNNLDDTKYMSNSLYSLEKSADAARRLLELEGAKQTMVDQRSIALDSGIQALILLADDGIRMELADLISQAEQFAIKEYTEETFKELTNALLLANSLFQERDITEGMAKQMINRLSTAMAQLEEDDSEQVKMSELEQYLEAARNYLASDDYTIASKAALLRAYTSALKVVGDSKAEQSDVDAQTMALKTAINILEKVVDKTALGEILSEVEGYEEDDYTPASYQVLRKAYLSGLLVYRDTSATANDVALAVSSLKVAKYALVNVSGATNGDLAAANDVLLSYINLAATYQSDDYTSTSWQVISVALINARIIYVSTTASASERIAAANILQSAISNLVNNSSSEESSSGSSSSTSSEKDGYYSVKVRLWHSTLNKASMGDDAVVRTAYVKIDDGEITMRLVTKKMSVSGITARLHDFWIYDGDDYEGADLVSTENSRWIFEYPLLNTTSTYHKCMLDPKVDVMGDDPVKARLKIDWSSLSSVDEDDWDELTGDVDEDDDDTISVSSSVSGTILSHSQTGIEVKGNSGGPAITLNAVKIEDGGDYDLIRAVLAETVSQFVLYDIALSDGTNTVQPKENVLLRIPVPDGYDHTKLVLYYIDENNGLQVVSGQVTGAYYEATVSHFSLYALVESNQMSVPESSQITINRTSISSLMKAETDIKPNESEIHDIAGRIIPYTGDRMPVAELAGLAMLAAMIGIGTEITAKKRMRGE